MRVLWVVATLGVAPLTGAALAQETDVQPTEMGVLGGDPWDGNGPPVMGTITAEGDGDRITWTTYDFSVGAYDASAWATRDNDGTGPQTLSLLGYSDWNSHDDRVFLTARLPDYATGIVGAALSLVNRDLDQPRQSGTITLNITEFTRDPETNGNYGHMTASGTGQLCSAQDRFDCFDVSVVIDTALQFGF